MNRPAMLCLLSALVGAGVSTFFRSVNTVGPAVAQDAVGQEQEPVRFPKVEPAASRRPVPGLPAPRQIEDDLTPEERVNVAVYENVNRSVVNISTKVVRGDSFFFSDSSQEGAGSGSVVDARGHILTNYHVVDGAREIQVTLYDGKSYEAKLVGKDESNDIAVLKINAPPGSLIPVVFGDSTRLKVGQKVFAIGNPFGLERTLTTGIISSLDRSLPTRNNRIIKSVIQIDAAINPGNSGGPLLDSHGRLIGMNTAIASSTGQSAGVGFAIPIANIARVVPQLVERGRVTKPDAGITRVLQTEEGLVIATMTPGGPAEKAGLRGFRIIRQKKKQGPFSYETQTIDRNAADMIVAVNDQKIDSAADFLALVESHQPGAEVQFTIVRDGREVKVPVRLVAADT